jgi:FtsH-binding integral membrane protein
MSPEKAKALFFGYAAILGLSLSSIFFVYSTFSIAYTFFVTASMFLSMVIYGYVTKKDLTNFGSFLMMGLIGLIIASIVNMFMRSSATSLVISAIGVIVFTGLTAYDTQIIKSYYIDSDSSATSEKKAIIGAMRLYLDFVNLFLYLLRFLGNRSNN